MSLKKDVERLNQMGYKIQNIRFFLSATWAFPLNPSTVVSDPGTYEEELKNGFLLVDWRSINI